MLARQLQRRFTQAESPRLTWHQLKFSASGRSVGSFRRGLSWSCQRGAPKVTAAEDSKTQERAQKSLFEELFPDESKSATPAWLEEIEDAQLLSSKPGPRQDPSDDPLAPYATIPGNALLQNVVGTHKSAVLVLSSASTSLVESDFLRIGAGIGLARGQPGDASADGESRTDSDRQTKRVDGWVSGITRIVPARDPGTLEPLGRYYIHFDSESAAAAYRAEAMRLFEQTRQLFSDAHKTRQAWRMLDEATRRAVEGFTLLAPGQRWSLEFGGGTRYERSARKKTGTVVEALQKRLGSRHLVLIVADGGRIATDTLRAAIRDDGVARNLPWRIRDPEGMGIVAFGKSASRKQDRAAEPSSDERESEGSATGEMSSDRFGEQADETDESSSPPPTGTTKNERWRKYPRFIVSFLDEVEARRFVRNWHKRKVSLTAEQTPGKEDDWEETRTLNVSFLW